MRDSMFTRQRLSLTATCLALVTGTALAQGNPTPPPGGFGSTLVANQAITYALPVGSTLVTQMPRFSAVHIDIQVLDFIAGDGGHGLHPMLGRVGFGPATD